MDRQTGATTGQMEAAPQGAVFVWCNRHLDYPDALAKKLGRSDLEIVGPSWLDGNAWRGRRLSGLIVDHAAYLSDSQKYGLHMAMARVTPNAGVEPPEGSARTTG
jgi:hypothetical protein